MIYDERMDKECIALCDILNSDPGISTAESCCGHGKQPFRIWFEAETVESLCALAMGCNCNYCNHIGWRIEVNHSESPNRALFMLEGPVGEEAYSAIADIAKTIADFRLIRAKEAQ